MEGNYESNLFHQPNLKFQTMPIYEYICKNCDHAFELLVMGKKKPQCPQCDSRRLDKQWSVFAATEHEITPTMERPADVSCGSCGDPRGPGSCGFN